MVVAEKLKLREQYGKKLETLAYFGFLGKNGETKKGDATHPSLEKALTSFTLTELEVAATFQEPTLLLVPETSFKAKVKAIDAHKNKGQADSHVDDIFTKSDSGSDKVTGWRVVIVDGAKEMELKEGDDKEKQFDQRIKARKAARKPSEKGMERHTYALLMMEGLRRGEPIDRYGSGKNTYTLLDDDPALSDSDVPDADWDANDRRVDFGTIRPGCIRNDARLRSSVGGRSII